MYCYYLLVYIAPLYYHTTTTMKFTTQTIALFLLSAHKTDADCSVRVHYKLGVNNWEEAKTFCKSKGSSATCIADLDEICPNGQDKPPFDGQKAGDQWVAINDHESNGWVQVGQWGQGAVGPALPTCKLVVSIQCGDWKGIGVLTRLTTSSTAVNVQ
jgi:hypothetical protein